MHQAPARLPRQPVPAMYTSQSLVPEIESATRTSAAVPTVLHRPGIVKMANVDAFST